MTGTNNVLHAAIEAGVKRIVCLGTDKAAADSDTYNLLSNLLGMATELIVSEVLLVTIEGGKIYRER